MTKPMGMVFCAQSSHLKICTSVPQMPARCTRMRTSLMPMRGFSTSSSQRPGSFLLLTSAFMMNLYLLSDSFQDEFGPCRRSRLWYDLDIIAAFAINRDHLFVAAFPFRKVLPSLAVRFVDLL